VGDVTRILEAIERGEPKAADELLPLVYEELRKLAAHKMGYEAAYQTLQPTALVHEAWVRLVGQDALPSFQNRAHFFAAAAEAMRRILVENARRKRRLRHGGGQERVPLEELDVAAETTDDRLLEVNDALDTLAREDPLEAEVVKLRVFVGLNHKEIAQALGLSEKTVQRYWAHAKVSLYQHIKGNSDLAL
jgi:RNA polymerase sigma factor (TIGR02999 family)